MKTLFIIYAALRSEKIETAKWVNRCSSLIQLAVVATGLENLRTDEMGNIVSFDCDRFKVVKEHSSKNYKELFPYEKKGKTVVIKVSLSYILGPILRIKNP